MEKVATPFDQNHGPVAMSPLTQAEREGLVNRMALQIRQSLELPEILQTCVTELRACLASDRLLIYQFQPDWSGVIIAESVAEDIASTLGNRINDSCFQKWQALALRGETPILANNIYAMGYEPCHVQLLEQYGVTANLVQPIYVAEQLWGLLIAHHCHGIRQWQPLEAQIVQDLSVQLAIAIQQSNLVAALKSEIQERQRLESSLQASQQQLTTLLDCMVAVVVLVRLFLDRRFEYEYISPYCQDLTGYAAADFFTNTALWPSRVHPEDWQGIIEPFLNDLIQNPPDAAVVTTMTYRFRRADETWCWIQGKWHLQWLETPGYWLATIINVQVTELKNTEVALRKTKAQYEKAQQIANLGYCELNLQTHELYWSPQVFRIFELDPQQVKATYEGWLGLVHPEDQDSLRQTYQYHLTAPEAYRIDYRLQMSDGRIKYLRQECETSFAQDGTPLVCMGTIQDLTTETTLKQEVAQKRKLENELTVLETVLDEALGGYWAWDMVTDQEYLSPGFRRMFGYQADAKATDLKSFREIIFPEDLVIVQQSLERHIQSRGQIPHSNEVRYRHRDGSIVWVLCSGQIIEWDKAGNPLRMVGGHVDITQDKHQELALQESESRLRDFVKYAPVNVAMFDKQMNYIAASQRWVDTYLSGSIESVVGRCHYELLPNISNRWRQIHQYCLQGNPQQCEEDSFTLQDGQLQWLKWEIQPWWREVEDKREVGGLLIFVEDITERKQTQLALEESQAFVQGITDASPDVLYVFDIVEQRNIYVNHQSTHAFGFSPVEVQAMGDRFLVDLIHPDDINQAFKHFEHLQRAQTGAIIENEYRLRAKDGSWRWFLSRDTIFKRNAAGEVQQIVGVAQDITHRKQVELQLQRQAQQERILTQILERMRSSIELDAVLTTTVEALREVLQSDRVLVYRVFENGTGAAIAESVLPQWESLLNRVFAEEIFPRQNYERYVNGRTFALYDRLAQSQLVLPCLIDFLQDIQVQAKLVVPIVQQNKLWGLVIAHQCDGPRNWQDWEINLLRRIANQLAIAIQQSDLYQRLQQELTQREFAQEQLGERNEELALANQQLVRATRLKDEFLANMSHELRTPLNAILGLTEGLLEEVFGPLTDRQSSSLQTIERSGSHLLSLINDILDVAKIEAGEVVLNCMSLSIKSLCENSLVFVKQLAQKKRIQLVYQIPDNLPNVWGDERRLHQVLINLLNNAVKFTPKGGRITLVVRLAVPPSPHHSQAELKGIERVPIVQPTPNLESPTVLPLVEISITDTGIGITPENLHKLFKPFIQIDSALNRQYEGTGLGLALVKQLVELHGGEVKVSSRLDIGSTFTVSLPIIPTDNLTMTDPIANLETTPVSMPEMPSPFSIVLAEDNEANAMTFVSYLEAKGYRMFHALNGEAAIALIQQETPDLVLMDIQMPVMDGLTAIQKIRHELGLTDLPIVALTALAMEGDEEKCLEAGANYYFSKPIKLKELTLLLQHLLKANR